MIVVCDTGPLLSAIARGDRHHAICSELFERHITDTLVVPVTVAVEVDHLVRARVGAEAARAFLADLDGGRYVAEPVGPAELARAREIDAKFADVGLGLVDCSVVAVAEALGAAAIFTLDQEHFRLVGGGWVLLPEHVGAGT